MKILYLNNSDVYNMDVIEVLEKRGHSITAISIPDEDYELSKQMLRQEKKNQEEYELTELMFRKKEENGDRILKIISEKEAEIVFSLGFYPCISVLCDYYGIIYVSWVIEPPYSSLFFSSIILKNNIVFLADKQMAEELQEEGIKSIFYLPKGVNINRCNRIINDGGIEEERWNLSFVGKIKDKSWEEYFCADSLKSSTKGYLDGIVACQRHVYGLDFFSKIIPKYVLDDLVKNGTIAPALGSVETLEHFYREQCFYPKTTVIDRLVMLDAMSNIGEVYLYSDNSVFEKKELLIVEI